jgi:hypothetical protein
MTFIKITTIGIVYVAAIGISQAGVVTWGPYSEGSVKGEQVSIIAEGSIGSCTRTGSPDPVTISGTVSGQTVNKYSFSGELKFASVFGLSGSWETEKTTGYSGTSGTTITSWCTAHNVDIGRDYDKSHAFIMKEEANGDLSLEYKLKLITVKSFYSRYPAVPDAVQPTNCTSYCPPN